PSIAKDGGIVSVAKIFLSRCRQAKATPIVLERMERSAPAGGAAGGARMGAEHGRGAQGGRTILIDAGIGGEFPHLPRAGLWAKRLEAAGIDLASVTDAVFAHLHVDYCGGLLADGVKERLRPDLRVHVAAAEAEFWVSPDFSHVSMPPGF